MIANAARLVLSRRLLNEESFEEGIGVGEEDGAEVALGIGLGRAEASMTLQGKQWVITRPVRGRRGVWSCCSCLFEELRPGYFPGIVVPSRQTDATRLKLFIFEQCQRIQKLLRHRSHSCRDAKQRRWIGGNSALVRRAVSLRYAATAFAKPAASFIDWLSVFPAQLRSGARESRSGPSRPINHRGKHAKSETRTRARCCSSTALVFANCARSSKTASYHPFPAKGVPSLVAFTTRSILPAHRRFGGTVV